MESSSGEHAPSHRPNVDEWALCIQAGQVLMARSELTRQEARELLFSSAGALGVLPGELAACILRSRASRQADATEGRALQAHRSEEPAGGLSSWSRVSAHYWRVI